MITSTLAAVVISIVCQPAKTQTINGKIRTTQTCTKTVVRDTKKPMPIGNIPEEFTIPESDR
jgi:hypothetical protein